MSSTIKNFTLSIDGVSSLGFNLELDGIVYRLDSFKLHQSLLRHNTLSFRMHKGPKEDINEVMFTVCGEIIGKEVSMVLQTENFEKISLQADNNDTVSTIEFKGIIVTANGCRNKTQYTINIEAKSWDVLLNDNAHCKSFEESTLVDIIKDVADEYMDKLDLSVNPRYAEIIPYCVQYNETNFEFLQRLARRYGEWFYNDGTHLIFGDINRQEDIILSYPTKEIVLYDIELKLIHPVFSHIASSYNSNDATVKECLDEISERYNTLGEKAFRASQDNFTKQTLQNIHSGGYSDKDSRENVLNVSINTQVNTEIAKLLTYKGKTFSSELKIGSVLIVKDNYIVDEQTLDKSEIEQEGILITEVEHCFFANETYSNTFVGISSECSYPPYPSDEVYPKCSSCRAKVIDNEDPNNLGRVRVQFDWQAELDDKMITPWLRMTQPYAGGGKGFSFIPEIGEEVMIDFEGGNAERPYVKGTLYNGVGDPDSKWLPNNNSSNQIKAIRTRNGHTIEIHDEGNDGYIRIYDNEKENYILTFSTDEKLIKLESTGNIELYAKNDIIMHAGHDINASADNDVFIAAGNDMQRTADNDIREHAGNDRSTSIDRNDSLTVEANQFICINDNKDEQIAHKLQITAENIREEAQDKFLQYSTTHQQKASDDMAMNAGNRIDIKASKVKVN